MLCNVRKTGGRVFLVFKNVMDEERDFSSLVVTAKTFFFDCAAV